MIPLDLSTRSCLGCNFSQLAIRDHQFPMKRAIPRPLFDPSLEKMEVAAVWKEIHPRFNEARLHVWNGEKKETMIDFFWKKRKKNKFFLFPWWRRSRLEPAE